MVENLPSSAGDVGSIPGWGTKSPHATKPTHSNKDPEQPKKKKRKLLFSQLVSQQQRTDKNRNFRSPAMSHLGEWLAGLLVHSRHIQSSNSHTIRSVIIHSFNKL